jgi:signal transduction histidine kinase/ligand-binding sensor domain-containing protein/DNA-binding NarL/FixJ family response regulator
MLTREKLCFTLLFLFVTYFILRGKEIQYDYLDEPVVVPGIQVNVVIKDSQGFIWFGTEQGLMRYDGYNTIIYDRVQGVSKSLSSQKITSIIEDKEGNLWLGTFQGGINMFDPKTETFHNFLTDSLSFGSKDINAMAMDQNGHLWIGYRNGGLDRFDPNNHKIINYQHIPDDKNSIISSGVSALFFDDNNNLWIGTWDNGLCLLENKELEKPFYSRLIFQDRSGYHNGSRINKIFSIKQDKLGNIWLASFGEGLIAYNPPKNRYIQLQVIRSQERRNSFRDICVSSAGNLITGRDNLNIIKNIAIESVHQSFMENKPYYPGENHLSNLTLTTGSLTPHVYSILEGANGLLWIGTDVGVYKLSPRKFNSYGIIPGKSSGNITAGTISESGRYFFSAWDDGIYYSKGMDDDIRTSKFSKLEIPGRVFDDITTIAAGKEDEIWFTSIDQGIFRYNLKTRKLTSYARDFQGAGVSNINYCRASVKGPGNSMWFGTAAGLLIYWPDTDSLYYYTENASDPYSLSNEFINCIAFESDTVVWMGTLQGGLNRGIIDKNGNGINKFEHFGYDYNDPTSISENNISSIFISSNGDLWVGTSNNGLNYFNREKENFTRYDKEIGFASNKISSIVEDNNKNLWLATPAGLIKFNPSENILVNYSISVDKQIYYFNNNGCFKRGDNLIFSTRENLITFDPSAISDQDPPDKIKITGLKVFNQIIHPGEKYSNKIILPKSIELADNLVLSFSNNTFSFYFSLLDFYSPFNNQYMYKLEGYDKKWIPTYSGSPVAKYSNVPPGDYKFVVKGANKDGVWVDSPTELNITILPPWYKSNPAIIMYLVILLGLAYLVRRITVGRVNYLNEIKLQKILHEKDNEVNQTKLKFFTNISHEIRTPVTLILAPLESIYNRTTDGALKNQIYHVLRNARKLTGLLGQLMDFRKIESGNLQLKVTRDNIVNYLKEVVEDFRESCVQKNIDIRLTTNMKEILVWYDAGKMDKIIRNLLSNAYKFTPRGGIIEVKAYTRAMKEERKPTVDGENGREILVVKITDNGSGIPEEYKEKVFDRFYQVENGISSNNPEGTGIGLSIVKEFVQMHRGEIFVDSIPNVETTFSIHLPLGNEHFQSHEIADPEVNNYSIPEEVEKGRQHQSDILDQLDDFQTGAPDYTILIVEDNDELRRFLRETLSKQYKIVEARNGIEGYEKARSELPELIISDVMMPEMDGLEMTQKLKNNIRTSHLPIILLTAKSAIEDRITGLKTGADSYIPKPFHPLHLEVRVQKLIALRKSLRAKFSKDLEINVEEMGIGSVDAEFLEKLKNIIEENIGDFDLSVEKLCKSIGMSRSNLFKKLKSLTDMSPSEFVRNVRLKKALNLMVQDRSLNIADVGYKVGFGSPSYFTHCFRNVYGSSPREFIENYKKRTPGQKDTNTIDPNDDIL